MEKVVTMKILSKAILLCLLCTVLGVLFAGCFLFDNADDEDNETEENTQYTLYVYNVEDSYLRAEKVTKGTEAYIYFGDGRYNFHGYFTEKNGNGNQITDSTGKVLEDFEAPSSSTAFAIYPYVSTITYTIRFVTDGNEVVPSETHTADEAFNLPEVNRAGYQFQGWNTSSDTWWGIKNVYAGQYTQDTTLYAIFKAQSYHVTYYTGITADYDRLEVAYGENYTVPYKEVKGYNFLGYYTEQNGQGVLLTYSNGDSISPWKGTEDWVNIYAHYKTAETFTLTYPNDGLVSGIEVTYKNWPDYSGGLVDHTVFYNDGETIPYLTPKRKGYYLDGWYKDSMCRNEYDFTSEENISDELALYAKWVEIPYMPQQYPLLSDAVKSGSLLLTSLSINKSEDVTYFCDFSGTFTVNYSVTIKPGPTDHVIYGADISIGDIFKVENGKSGAVEVTVKKGNLFRITGQSLGELQKTTLEYSIGDFPEATSGKQVKMPTEFTYTVTQGNSYKLPVYEKYNYVFVGYYTLPDGKGTRLTDGNGKSYTVWTDGNDATIYPHYKIKSK